MASQSRKRSLVLYEDEDYQSVHSNRRWCDHCDSYLALKTFKSHKRLFYSEATHSWDKVSKAKVETVCEHGDDTSSAATSSTEESPPCSDIEVAPRSPSTTEHDFEPPDVGYAETSSDESEPTDEISEPSDTEEGWNDNELLPGEDSDDSNPDDDIEVAGVSSNAKVLTKWLVLFLMQLQSRFKLPNSALNCMFAFLFTFFCVLGTFHPLCKDIAKLFPRSIYSANIHFAMKANFVRYVVCRKCKSIYLKKDCVDSTGTRPKNCSFIEFPSHPQRRMRQVCACPLLKTVELLSGKRILYPFISYCYLSVTESLRSRFLQTGFSSMCEEWRTQNSRCDVYSDIFDGKVWKDFQLYDGKCFLKDCYNLGLMINMDFFQPYKHVNYSVGAVYCVVMNLPRTVRYKQENVVLLGLIPGPHEPERNINSFLEPFVQELKALWNGADFKLESGLVHKVRCALLCVACDMPAGRKTCGFLSHTAILGCTKCLKSFPGDVGNKDYSGFDRENWIVRTMQHHRDNSSEILKLKTKSARSKRESELGCRYSVLSELSYFDAPRFLIVDPMHNLYLGTAKHMVKDIWLQHGIISDNDFQVIQDRVDLVVAPADIGRIPHKIRSGFASFTADQWKNWVNYYSLLCTTDFLHGEHLECWRHFVLASRLLSCRELQKSDLQVCDALLLRFCKRVERLYGKTSITPNMHMHTHLKSCIEDYGPCHAFWLYAFERYNGILGSYPNSNRNIEVQLMNRFVNDEVVLSCPLPSQFEDRFKEHFSCRKLVGSTAESVQPACTSSSVACPWLDDRSLVLPSFRSRCILTETQCSQLSRLYSELYQLTAIPDVACFCWKYQSIELNGKRYGTFKSNSKSSSLALAMWRVDLFGSPVAPECHLTGDSFSRPARINSFYGHSLLINGKHTEHLLVDLSWYSYHPKYVSFGKPVTAWCPDIFEAHFITPVHLIQKRCISFLYKSVTSPYESLLLVCPTTD